MKLRRLVGGFCIVTLWVATGAPAGAQRETKSVSDPDGRYTISLPADWQTMTLGGGGSTTTRDITSALTPLGGGFSMVVAAPGGDQPVYLGILAMTMPEQIDPLTFKDAFGKSRRMDDYSLIQEGSMTLAGLPAYYQYFTWRSGSGSNDYSVVVVASAGRVLYFILGGTHNDAAHVQRDIPVLVRVINTFRPTSK